ncbi:MAG: thiamine phosphate synthase [Geminicoccaceae bacterium]
MSRSRSRAAVDTSDGPWLESGDEGTRLLVFGVPEPAVLASGAVAALVLPPAALTAGFQALRQEHRLPILLRGDAALAAEQGLDGVHLADGEKVADARRTLGRDALIGIDCGLSRHAAMVAGEAGADYVLFGSLDLAPPGAVSDLVRWWRELFVLPCAVAGRYSPDSARAMAAAGSDFIATSEADATLAQAILIDGSS